MSALPHPLSPPSLRAGDRVRFVSPASSPDRDAVLRRARLLEDWGLVVDFGAHAFDHLAFHLAGTDDERAADLNEAFRDPAVRAVFATRDGKGSYRIADRLDLEAVRRDPKFLVGFSDVTILHLMLQAKLGLVGVHGAIAEEPAGTEGNALLRTVLTTDADVTIAAREEEETASLTSSGVATGILIGGNLEMVATAAGWALPPLVGRILLLEAVDQYLGQVDRLLTMLRKSGRLDGVVGVAVGQFTNCRPSGGLGIRYLLREHLTALGVPILGGLPLGHGERPLPVPTGALARLDADARTLTVFRGEGPRPRARRAGPPRPRISVAPRQNG